MNARRHTKFVREGLYAAEVEVELIEEDNGWSPYAPELRVEEVSGDHDSMVLEPNVRVLAARLTQALRNAEGAAELRLEAAE